MTSTLLRISDLTVELGGNPILKGVNANIERGAITALIGLNGSGKTTLLRTVLKEVPYKGTMQFFCGHDHRRQRPEYIGYVPQKLHIDARLPITVRDLMALALQKTPLFFGVSASVEKTMREILALVFDQRDPRQILDSPVESISGGELQRVLMALAMHPKPELLLLDEPAAGIDFQKQTSFYELIAKFNRDYGVSVILVSHELSIVSRYAHHVLCLKDGVVQCQGAPKMILNGEMLHDIYGSDMGLFVHHHHHD